MTRIQFNLAMKYWQANYNERGEMKYPKETNRYFRQSTKKLREDGYDSFDEPRKQKSGKIPYYGRGYQKKYGDDHDDSFSVERSDEHRPERRLTPRRHTSKHLNVRHESPDGYLSDRGRPKPGHDTLPVDI